MIQLLAIFSLAVLASAEVVHPCDKTPTRECYGGHLAKVAGCIVPPEIPKTDSWNVRPALIEVPFFRGTLNRYRTTVEGVANVNDFVLFYDTVKNITVLSYNFPKVTVYGREEIQYHKPGSIDTVIDTAFRTVYTNINVTAQWNGTQKITIGTAKLYSYIDSSKFDIKDYPELAAEIKKNPYGVAARDYQLALFHPEIYLREQESPVGRQIVRPFFNNWLCSNLPKDS